MLRLFVTVRCTPEYVSELATPGDQLRSVLMSCVSFKMSRSYYHHNRNNANNYYYNSVCTCFTEDNKYNNVGLT